MKAIFVQVIIVLVFYYFTAITNGQNTCPNFEYVKNNNGEILGQLTFTNDLTLRAELAVNMSVEAFLASENIKIELISKKEIANGGNPILYYIHFPIQSPLPTVIGIQFNGKVYCSGEAPEVQPGHPVSYLWASSQYGVSKPITYKNPSINKPTLHNKPTLPSYTTSRTTVYKTISPIPLAPTQSSVVIPSDSQKDNYFPINKGEPTKSQVFKKNTTVYDCDTQEITSYDQTIKFSTVRNCTTSITHNQTVIHGTQYLNTK